MLSVLVNIEHRQVGVLLKTADIRCRDSGSGALLVVAYAA
jgi:hypothetical protein